MRNQFIEFNSGSIDENRIFGDRFEFLSQLCEIRGQIEWIENLTVNWGLNHANQKPETKIKKARTFKVAVEILTGIRCIKLKVKTNWGCDWINQTLKDQIAFSKSQDCMCCTVLTPEQCRAQLCNPQPLQILQRQRQ